MHYPSKKYFLYGKCSFYYFTLNQLTYLLPCIYLPQTKPEGVLKFLIGELNYTIGTVTALRVIKPNEFTINLIAALYLYLPQT